jgi:hypothetical protein
MMRSSVIESAKSLTLGYKLYGSPAATYNGKSVILAELFPFKLAPWSSAV